MSEPRFLSREQIDTLHDRSLSAFGGSTGMRDENGLESALAAAANVWLYEKETVSKSPRPMPFIWPKRSRFSMATNGPPLPRHLPFWR